MRIYQPSGWGNWMRESGVQCGRISISLLRGKYVQGYDMGSEDSEIE